MSSKTLRRIQLTLRRDGAVSLGALFPAPLLEWIQSEVMRRHACDQLRRKGLVRDIAGRYAAVLPFEGPFLSPDFYANPRLIQIVAALLGADHCIGSLEAVISEPGAYEQHQHIDAPIRFDQVVGKRRKQYLGDLADLPPYAVTLYVPLCDIDETNGPTAVWRGSHRAALLPKIPTEREIVRDFPEVHMAGKFGDCFLFDYRAFHRGLPNLSREPRPLLLFIFTRSWFRDPNLIDVYPNVAIGKRDFQRVPDKHKRLFMLAPAARRGLWR